MLVWMLVVLKIPVIALLWLVWWAVKEPKPQEEEPVRVQRDPAPEPDHPRPRRPRPPRRGPHAEPAPPAPGRVRAAGRMISRPRPLR